MSEPAPLPRAAPPGWYPERPTGRQRWWDGIQWAFYADGAQAAPAPSAANASRPYPTNRMATASLVLGIVGIFACTLIVPSVLAVVFGMVGLRTSRERGGAGRGNATWGLVLGGTMLAILIAIGIFSAVS